MSNNRLKLIVPVIIIAMVAILLFWSHNRGQAEIQQLLNQADRDVAAAKGAADRAEDSATQANEAAKAAQNQIPGSS